MKNHTLLEILQDKRVQKLINMALKTAGCKEENTIEKLKSQLKGKEGPSEKWQQLEIKM